MKDKKGRIGLYILFSAMAGLFVFAIVFPATFDIFKEKFYPIFNFFGFDLTQPVEGVSIVGIDLNKISDSGGLYYYTGEKWKEFKKLDENFKLGDYEFVPEKVKDELSKFYVIDKRIPPSLNLEIKKDDWDGWRHWSSFGLLRRGDKIVVEIFDKKKEGYEGSNNDYKFDLLPDGSLNGDGSLMSDSELTSTYRTQIPKLEAWRDQILAGKPCEKFVSFDSLKFNGESKKDNKYSVAKVGQYIFVDFEKDVEKGVEQRYKDGCYDGKYEKFEDIERDDWINLVAKLEFAFEGNAPHGRKNYSWYTDSRGWIFEQEGKDPIPANEMRSGKYKVINNPNNLYSGLRDILLADRNKGLNNVAEDLEVWIELKEYKRLRIGNLPIVEEGVEEGKGKIFIYKVLDAYNEYFVSPIAFISKVVSGIDLGDYLDTLPGGEPFPGDAPSILHNIFYYPQSGSSSVGLAGPSATDELVVRTSFDSTIISDSEDAESFKEATTNVKYVLIFYDDFDIVKGVVEVEHVRPPLFEEKRLIDLYVTPEKLKEAGLVSGSYHLDIIVYSGDGDYKSTETIGFSNRAGGALILDLPGAESN